MVRNDYFAPSQLMIRWIFFSKISFIMVASNNLGPQNRSFLQLLLLSVCTLKLEKFTIFENILARDYAVSSTPLNL